MRHLPWKVKRLHEYDFFLGITRVEGECARTLSKRYENMHGVPGFITRVRVIGEPETHESYRGLYAFRFEFLKGAYGPYALSQGPVGLEWRPGSLDVCLPPSSSVGVTLGLVGPSGEVTYQRTTWPDSELLLGRSVVLTVKYECVLQ